jgi:hypothetical protein
MLQPKRDAEQDRPRDDSDGCKFATVQGTLAPLRNILAAQPDYCHHHKELSNNIYCKIKLDYSMS